MKMKSKMFVAIGLVGLLLAGGYIVSTVWGQGPGGPWGGPGMGCPMGGPMGGPGMGMGWYPGFLSQNIDQAAQAAQQYLAAFWRNPDLVVKEVMEFSNQFYVQIKEQSTGIGAMELLVDKFSGLVQPEYGPNMMWNFKYGHMGRGMMGPGMMGGARGVPTAQMPVTSEQAKQIAQQYLNAYIPGATVTEEITAFYGYYTIDLQRDGQIFGMLSINGVSGQVWYHSWHGQFIAMKEF